GEGEGAGGTVIPGEVQAPPHAAFMWLGRVDVGVTACVEGFELVLVQDLQDVNSSVIALRVPKVMAALSIGDTSESISLDVQGVSLVPCVSTRQASHRLPMLCLELRETATAIALRCANPGTPRALSGGDNGPSGSCMSAPGLGEVVRAAEGETKHMVDVRMDSSSSEHSEHDGIGLPLERRLVGVRALPDLVKVVHGGLPVKTLELSAIKKRQIMEPIDMHVRYSTDAAQPGVRGANAADLAAGGGSACGAEGEETEIGARVEATM
ncbi:unnamed protein product, partial [Discosporangium mesarthrocarpum]